MSVLVASFGPAGLGLVCAALLVWQAIAWGSAPASALLAQQIALTPSRLNFKESPQTTGARPSILGDQPRRLTLVFVVVDMALLLTPAIATSPAVDTDLQQELAAIPSPTPGMPTPVARSGPVTPAPKSTAPKPPGSPTAGGSSNSTPHPGPGPTQVASPSLQATATPSHPVPSPSPRGTIPPSPTPHP